MFNVDNVFSILISPFLKQELTEYWFRKLVLPKLSYEKLCSGTEKNNCIFPIEICVFRIYEWILLFILIILHSINHY
jgi:hypothetical protein